MPGDFHRLRFLFAYFSKKEQFLFVLFAFAAMVSSLVLLRFFDERYATLAPLGGGTLREGVVGSPRFINPLLAISDTDRDLVNLIYAGLMRPDGQGGFEPELAESYEISEDGLRYTFHLKKNLLWHDGKFFGSDDVLFTIGWVRDPALRSPLRAQWEGVRVEKIDEYTITVALDKPYAPFIGATTLGILPKHRWEHLTPQEFTVTPLNRSPIGMGPYRVASFEEQGEGGIRSYTLKAFSEYALGKPYINRVIIEIFPNEEELRAAYQNETIDAMGIISPSFPLAPRASSHFMHFPLPRLVGVFFNPAHNELLDSFAIREALWHATDTERIINEALGGQATSITSPLPYVVPKKQMPTYDPQKARQAIVSNKDYDEENPPIFQLVTAANPQLAAVAKLLKEMWEQAGVRVEVQIFEVTDLERNVIRPREYDALLFGQVVGYNPDPFAFWHSSQRTDPGLNIANYSNVKVDKILEEARSTNEAEKRDTLSQSFVDELLNDLPALFLYQPLYVYAAPTRLEGINTDLLDLPAGRFSNVEQWYVMTEHRWNFLPSFLKDFIL
ncbi:MAG: ABC transporter substrate-binding protein [Patescibacteria group bacterium]